MVFIGFFIRTKMVVDGERAHRGVYGIKVLDKQRNRL
jgi:hypothetical protein